MQIANSAFEWRRRPTYGSLECLLNGFFGRSDQLESMANSNPAPLRTPSECRLAELCLMCVFKLCHSHPVPVAELHSQYLDTNDALLRRSLS